MIVADLKYAEDAVVKRAYHISKYEADRLNGTVALTVGVFASMDKRNAMKAAIAAAKAAQATADQLTREGQKLAFDFSQLSSQEQSAKRDEFNSALAAKNADIETARKTARDQTDIANKNGPIQQMNYTIPSDSINVESFALTDLYNALKTQLAGVDEGVQ